jgi:hypothetical protein
MALAAVLAPATPGGVTAATAKLDPRLAALVAAGSSDSLPVWVEFRDKGEDGPESMARMLAAARAALTPRALARRLRAHVEPLVDARDVPVWTPYLDILVAHGFRPYGVSRWFNHAAVRTVPGRFVDLAALDAVRWIEPVERGVPIRDLPGGPLAGLAPGPAGGFGANGVAINYGLTQAELAQVNLPAVHNQGYIGIGVLVCMLDDGFNHYKQHQAVMNQVIAPFLARDFVDGDYNVEDYSQPWPDLQHGTWTFATAGGNAAGSFVGSGYGAKFALGRTEVDASEHVVEMVYWGQGAEWADSIGADIISSSLGYNTFDPPDPSYTYADMNGHTTIITRAAEIAASKGILVVNSAGNEASNSWHYIIAPADMNGDSLIAVGAVDLSGVITSFSSRGPTSDGRIKPDLCAMGSGNPLPNVDSPFNPTAYWNASGTSFSAPLIAGVCACLMQARPSATAVEIIQSLRVTASQAGSPDDVYGYGIPDAAAALNYLITVVGVPGPSFHITPAGPNPLRAGQSMVFQLSSGAAPARGAALRVLDGQGRIVRRLWSGDLGAALIPAVWDGRDDQGRYVSPGLYFAHLEAAGQNSTARVVFLR